MNVLRTLSTIGRAARNTANYHDASRTPPPAWRASRASGRGGIADQSLLPNDPVEEASHMSRAVRLPALSLQLAHKAMAALRSVTRHLAVLRYEYSLAIYAAERATLHRHRRSQLIGLYAGDRNATSHPGSRDL